MLAAILLASMDGAAKKGLQVQMLNDAVELGVRHAAINVQMGDFITIQASPGDVKLDGTNLHVKSSALQGLDAMLGGLKKHGIKTYAILLARATGRKEIDQLILHPRYDPSAPNRLGAFRITDRRGRSTLAAFCKFVQQRHKLDAWIVGNEVNSHEAWFNMGPSEPSEIADAVERSLRVVHEAVKPSRVYLSLDHFWAARHLPTQLDKSAPGKEILDRVADLSSRRGDFPWHVAHHPYPENLFEPRFWNDRTAVLTYDTQRVTFKNLEVLTEYLKQPRLTFRGEPRRVILSEQGFHRPEGDGGEDLQAAAYAYAWRRVVANPGIDAFILHRHVDHAQEGGLRLGLWTNKTGSIADPDRKTRMWHVMKAAGTNSESQMFDFAVAIVGRKLWEAPGPTRLSAPNR